MTRLALAGRCSGLTTPVEASRRRSSSEFRASRPTPARPLRRKVRRQISQSLVSESIWILFSGAGASAQCHLVVDRKFNMMETAADVTIEERSLGRGGKQVVKQMWGHCGVLVTSAVAEVQLQFTTMLVIAGRGQHRGFQTHPALSGSRHRLASSAGEDLRKGKCPPRPQISRG